MTKYIFIVLVLFFAGCQMEPTTFQYNNKKQLMSFYLNDEMFNVKLKNPFYQNRFDQCTSDAYTLYSQDSEFGRIGIENINLHVTCSWTALDQSIYEYFIKKELKLKSFYALERVPIKNYEFVTYSINDEYVINMIYIYSVTQSTFILDYKGVLFDTLINKLKPDFENKYKKYPRYNNVLNTSIVNENIFFHHFTPEREERTSD